MKLKPKTKVFLGTIGLLIWLYLSIRYHGQTLFVNTYGSAR